VIKVDPEHKKLALSIKEYLIEKNQMNHDDIVMSGKGGKKSKKKSDVKKSKDREEDEDSDE
jgi:small subunit ribosomal protein S1